MQLKYILILLVLSSIAFSATMDIQIESQSCSANASFLDVIFNLPTCIVEKFFSYLVNGLIYSAKEFLENSLSFIIAGPNIDAFCAPYSKVMKILESLYTITLMGVGAYYILSSSDPEKRAKAKMWMQNVLLLIIALSFSFSLFKMVIEINQYITASIYNESFSDTLNINASFSSLIFAFVLSIFFIIASAITFITLLIRYLMIPFMLLLFPIAIFLYFIPFTKEWGSFLLKFIMIIIFMTAIDAIIVLGTSYLFSINDPNISGGFVQAMMLMLGFGLIGIVNIIIYIIAILSLIFTVVKMFESAISLGWKIAMLAAFL